MAVVPDRNADGTVSAKVTLALAWFHVAYELKPMATSAYPTYYFRNRDGEQVEANVQDILDAHEAHKAEYKRANKAKTKAALRDA